MKNYISRNLIFVVAISTSMLSFMALPGGEYYRISLNGEKMIEQFLTRNQETPTLQINAFSAKDKLTVYYNHCGKIGTDRVLTLKNDKIILKKWTFDKETGDQISVNVNDLVESAGRSKSCQLIYSSKELSEGRVLANIELDQATVRK